MTHSEAILDYFRTHNNQEIWAPIPGFSDRYEASTHGRIRSLRFVNSKANFVRDKPLVLKPTFNRRGYSHVTLMMSGKPITRSIHLLVLLTFKGSRPINHVVGHRDGNPRNNHLYNLDWITYKENEEDKRRHGRTLCGSKNHESKLTEDDVLNMRILFSAKKATREELSLLYGTSRTNVSDILNLKAWKHVPNPIEIEKPTYDPTGNRLLFGEVA